MRLFLKYQSLNFYYPVYKGNVTITKEDTLKTTSFMKSFNTPDFDQKHPKLY
ncbi:MAG: hypothetical protein ACI8YQ_002662 [Polaribacter sp.]|jgi:hypothetical protein